LSLINPSVRKNYESTTMNDNNKISVGLLIPAISVVAFVATLFNENYLGALFVAVSGLLLWFAFSAVVKAEMPDITGNIVIVFGVLLSLAFFLNYGMDTNIFGGFEFKIEGAVGSLLVLFFTVLLGLLFNNKAEQNKLNQVGSDRTRTVAENMPHIPATDNESGPEFNDDYESDEELEDYYLDYDYDYEEGYED